MKLLAMQNRYKSITNLNRTQLLQQIGRRTCPTLLQIKVANNMPTYRKGEGQWTPEKQAGLIERAKAQGEARYRREGMAPSSISPKDLQKDAADERGWAIGMNPHIKVSNVQGPVSGAGIAKGKAGRAKMSSTMVEIQNTNMAANPDLKV